jgi:uncharacterized damage-inducible protein DinB
MTHKSESQILADTFEAVRGLTKFYISKLENLDIRKQYTINGVSLNTALWITAHLVWTEHSLLIEGLGGKKMDIPWLEEFSIGSSTANKDTWPEYDEVLKRMDEVHNTAMKLLRSLSDDELDKPNLIDANFMGKNSKRNVITHAIRHEPMHTGQISWILKLNSVEMP